VVIAAWWAAFALPLLLTAREGGAGSGRGAGRSLVGEGFARVAATLRKIRRLPQLARFLLAFLFYHTGIGTMMVVAAIFAKGDLHLSDGTVVGCLLMVQFVAMPAAFGFIALSRAIGSRNCIVLGIVVFIGVVLFATQMHFAWQFWVLGAMVALVTGGTQAISRSIFGSMIPPGLNAEFFGFFSVYAKVGSFAGPLVFGLCRDLTGSSRLSILFVAAFFVAGLAILLTVRVNRGVEEAAAFELGEG
jgi:UMF1 family MFS transporter